jgi:hypothetical protein
MYRASGERPREGVLARLSFWGGAGRAADVTTAALAAAITTVALCGCQTTAERSAELQRAAKHAVLASRGVNVTKESPSVKVLYSTVVRSKEGAAVVIGLRDVSKQALENAPIEITVRDARGAVLFQNNQPGLDPSLTQVSLLVPGAETLWIDDQVRVSGIPVSASALVGEATRVSGSMPRLSVSGTHLTGEAGSEAGAAGTVANRSRVGQPHLVVYAVGRRGSRIVAAGRAVLPEVAAGASVPFQLYFVGDPGGARIEASAPATTIRPAL